jgi:hypothetical protein
MAQLERVNRKEIVIATLRGYLKAIKLFSDVAELPITWKRITRGLPKGRKFADDRAPTIEEIRRLAEYPDRRIKAIIYDPIALKEMQVASHRISLTRANPIINPRTAPNVGSQFLSL